MILLALSLAILLKTNRLRKLARNRASGLSLDFLLGEFLRDDFRHKALLILDLIHEFPFLNECVPPCSGALLTDLHIYVIVHRMALSSKGLTHGLKRIHSRPNEQNQQTE